MKKIILTILTLTLAACAQARPMPEKPDPAQAETQIAEIVNQEMTASALTAVVEQISPLVVEQEAIPVELSTSYENAVSPELQLLLGVFKLEGSDLAITAEQGKALLPVVNNLKMVYESVVLPQGNPNADQGSSTLQPSSENSEFREKVDELVKLIRTFS